MAQSGETWAGRSRAVRFAGLAAVVLLGAGVAIQAGFVARHAHTELTAPREHGIRELLEVAARRVPRGDRYAITSLARTPNAIYFLGYRPVEGVGLRGTPAAVHDRLTRARVRYVIVLDRNRPRAFRSRHRRWYRILATTPSGQLLELV
jgi:hypothetical protein